MVDNKKIHHVLCLHQELSTKRQNNENRSSQRRCNTTE